jgi:hypothetical protein
LRFWWEDSKTFSDREPILISKFRLFIFEHFPTKLLRLSGDSWNDFFRLGRKRIFASNKARANVRSQILEKYRFSVFIEGALANYVDRDGEHQLMDPHDGFCCFKNEDFVVTFEEYCDEI